MNNLANLTTEKLYMQDSYLTECQARIIYMDENILALDRTVFYATSGGQIGDKGEIIREGYAPIQIERTEKHYVNASNEGIFHYYTSPVQGPSILSRKEQFLEAAVYCKIDATRRYNIMKMHTLAHLLCAVLPYHVNGCNITNTSARLDFVTNDHFNNQAIEEKLNNFIQEAHNVSYEWITREELQQRQELVRTINAALPMGDDIIRLVKIGPIDIQPCGGTHVKNTAEIGKVAVLKTKKISASSRRISVGFAADNE